jgi:hypothetical protein
LSWLGQIGVSIQSRAWLADTQGDRKETMVEAVIAVNGGWLGVTNTQYLSEDR